MLCWGVAEGHASTAHVTRCETKLVGVRWLARRTCLEIPRCNRLWLDDHLISPIQRVLRYNLLLKDLLKRTPPDHPDFAYLREARPALLRGCGQRG